MKCSVLPQNVFRLRFQLYLYVSLPFSIGYHVKPSNKLYTLYLCLWYCKHALHFIKDDQPIQKSATKTLLQSYKNESSYSSMQLPSSKAWSISHLWEVNLVNMCQNVKKNNSPRWIKTEKKKDTGGECYHWPAQHVNFPLNTIFYIPLKLLQHNWSGTKLACKAYIRAA